MMLFRYLHIAIKLLYNGVECLILLYERVFRMRFVEAYPRNWDE